MLETTNISTSLCFVAKNSSDCNNLPYYFLTFSFGINLILGFPAHCYILWLIMKEMIRGQSIEVFILNTSLVEVIFNFSFPFLIKQYFFSCTSCMYVLISFGYILVVGRPLFQTCTCIERYVGVLYPVTFLKFKPIKYRMVICIIGWNLIICLCFLAAFEVFNTYNLLLAEYIAFLIIKMFTCSMVLKALRHAGPGDNVKKRDGLNRDKVKAFQIILIVLVSSLLTYGPFTVCLVLYYVLDLDTFLVSLSVSTCLAIMLGFVQPLLYLKRVSKVCLCFGI